MKFLNTLFLACIAASVFGDFTSAITPLPNEKWWGGSTGSSKYQPYLNTKKPIDLTSFGGQAAPFLVSSAGRYVWSERPFTFAFTNGVLYVVSKAEKIEPIVAGTTLKDAYLAASRKHFPFTGTTPPELFFTKPQFNNWIEIYIRGTTQKVVNDTIDELVEHKFPVGVYMMDGGYMTHQGSYKFVQEDFPNPVEMFDKIRANGWKSIIWTAHFVSPDSREYKRLRYHPNTDGLDILAHRKHGREAAVVRWWSGISAIYDITNPKGYKFFVKTLKDFMKEYHIDGFKFDAGDSRRLYDDIRFHEPHQEGVDYTHIYTLLGAENFPYNEFRIGFKSGGLPLVQRLHDVKHLWSELLDVSPGVQISGLLGSPYVVGDMIGGGDCVSYPPSGRYTIDEKLFVRSCALQTLMPMMQFSLAPWRVLSKENCDICRDFAELHMKFGSYIMKWANHAAKTGEPIVRMMEYEFPNQGFNRPMQQYMFGPDYLVAPVVNKDDSVTVELPKGKWQDDAGEIIEGPKVFTLKDVPLKRLPYYKRLGK